MTLRVRIVALAAGIVAVVVLVVGVSVYRSTESALVDEIDADLRARVDPIVHAGNRPLVRPGGPVLDLDQIQRLMGRGSGGGGPVRGGRTDPFGTTVGFDALVRVLDDRGEVRGVLDAGFDAPTDAAFLARADGGPVLVDGRSDSGRVRVITVALPRQGYLQIARPLDEVDAVLGELQTRSLVIGLLAMAGAALAAWFVAGRATASIRELTSATEHIAATGDLDDAAARQVGEGAASAGRDEVGRLASSFTAMLDALSRARRQQRQLVMDASHELRTPLTSLRTNVDVLRRGHELAPEARAALVDDLDAELAELTDLVTELVDLAGDVRSDEPMVPVRLDEVAAPVIERARRRSDRPIELDVVRSAVVDGRPEALGRAVRNLVENAVKFSPAGTAVRVVVDGTSLVVHDRGPGIPTEARAAVFERFHRLESSRGLPGSGLGLAIVAQVIEAHDGTTVVEDSPDGGAAIGFRLPEH